jgi:hypothetical protein
MTIVSLPFLAVIPEGEQGRVQLLRVELQLRSVLQHG